VIFDEEKASLERWVFRGSVGRSRWLRDQVSFSYYGVVERRIQTNRRRCIT
jgi:hypothetical protein